MKARNYYSDKSLDYGISKRRKEAIIALLEDIKNTTVLDVGCSTGYLGKEFIDRGAKVYGIDISKKALNEARKVLTKVNIIDLNKQKLPFSRGQFDLIVASEVIEHLQNPLLALKELNRVLKNNGGLIITTPNFLYWGNRIKFLKGKFAYEKIGMFDEGHVHFYTYDSLKNDLKKSNFKIIEENHLYPGSSFFNVFKKYFPELFAYQFVIKCAQLQS